MPGAAFLQAEGSSNDHDLGLFQIGADAADSPAGRGAVGLYHLAWEVDTLDELERIAAAAGRRAARWSARPTTPPPRRCTRKDPDGLEFEVSWLLPADLITDDVLAARSRHRPARPGRARRPATAASTRGGVGVSVASAAGLTPGGRHRRT